LRHVRLAACAAFAGLLLLAGCLSPSQPGADTAPSPTAATVVAGQADAKAHAPPVTGPCAITRTAVNTALGYGVNPDAPTGAKVSCKFSEVVGIPAANLTRFQEALVEVRWQAQPTESSIGVRVNANCVGGDQPETPGQACVLGKAVGTTPPLRLVLGSDVMGRYAAGDPEVYVYSEGASVEHSFDLRVSLFEVGPIADSFTGFQLL